MDVLEAAGNLRLTVMAKAQCRHDAKVITNAVGATRMIHYATSEKRINTQYKLTSDPRFIFQSH